MVDWMTIARETGTTLSRTLAETTVSQFYQWCALFEMELEQPTRVEIYLAELIYHLFETPGRVFGKSSGLDPSKFVIKFHRGKKPDKPDEMTEEQKKEHIARSKAMWKGMLRTAKQRQEDSRPIFARNANKAKPGGGRPPGTARPQVVQQRGKNGPPTAVPQPTKQAPQARAPKPRKR